MIAPLVVKPINNHDTILLPESFDAFTDFASLIGLDLAGSYVTLDLGFYSEHNHWLIRSQGIAPVIKPNRRSTKDETKIEMMYENFNELISKERFKIEQTFA